MIPKAWHGRVRRRGTALAAACALLVGPAPGEAHEDALLGGPRLGLSAADVLRVPLPAMAEGRSKPEMAFDHMTATREERSRFATLGRGPGGGPAVVHRGGRVLGGQARVPRLEPRDTGVPAGEPTLAVARDGTLFFVGLSIPSRDDRGGSTIHSVLIRSRDGGRTWQELDATAPGVSGETTTLDPFITIDDATGRLVNADYTPPCAIVSVSTDSGDSFTARPLCGQHTDHQALAFGPPVSSAPQAGPHLLYYCAIDGGALAQGSTMSACSKSLDGGLTFTRTGAPAFVDDPSLGGGQLGVPGHCSGAHGHPVVDARGWLWLPRGYCGQPYVAISKDEGATWKRVQVAANGLFVGAQFEEHEAAVAVDREGNAYYLWLAQDHLPYLSVSRDGGETWSAPLMVGPPGLDEAMLPSMEVGDPGRLALLYMGTTTGPGGPYCVATTPDSCTTADGTPPKGAAEYAATTWNGYVATSTDALSPKPTFATATVNDPADPLVRGVCGPVRCQQAYDFLDVDVAADGSAWAAFVDACTPDPAQACPPLGKGVIAQLVGGPPLIGRVADQKPQVRGSCVSRRRFEIRLREPRRGRIRSATIVVDGKRVPARRRGGRWRGVVDLRGRPRGTFVVRVIARTTAGRTFRSTRRYRTCG